MLKPLSILFSAPPFEEPLRAKDVAEALTQRSFYLFPHEPKSLKKKIEELEWNELWELIKEFYGHIIENNLKMGSLEAFAAWLPFEKIEEIIKNHFQEDRPLLEQIAQTADAARAYLYTVEKTQSDPFSAKDIFSTLLSAIETVIRTIGIIDFLDYVTDRLDSDQKVQRLTAILGLITLATSILIPALGTTLGILSVATLFFLTTALSYFFMEMRSFPAHLQNCTNLGKLYQKGRLEKPVVRMGILNQIVTSLVEEKKVPILVGPEGVGKTEIIASLTHAIKEGLYPKLEGANLFYVNFATIGSDTNNKASKFEILDQIAHAIGNHGERVIVVFDNIHLAFEPLEGFPALELLQGYLDKKFGSMMNVIGVTTSEQFDHHISSSTHPIRQKLQTIEVPSTKEEETVAILHSYLIRHYPHICFDEKVLLHLVKHSETISPKNKQPKNALELLNKAIALLGKEREAVAFRSQLGELRLRWQTASAWQANYTELNHKIKEIENKLHEVNQRLQKAVSVGKQLMQVQMELAKRSIAISNLARKILGKREKQQITEYFILERFRKKLVQTLEQSKFVLTEELINSCVK